MNTHESPRAVFRPRARLLSILGEQLISDQTVGLIELVKNAYDADATLVEVDLLNLTLPEMTRIAIRDNGSGMTREDIEQKWLSPAVNHKERQKKANQRTALGRLPIGEKGVGRFAAQQLGHRLQLISRSDHTNELVVQINWDDFEGENIYLDDVPVVLYERDPITFMGEATGTILVIEQARTAWNDTMVAKIQRALRRLQSPLHEVRDFQIAFRCPDFPAYEDISNSDILDHAHYTFRGAVTNEGLLDYEYFCGHPAVPERAVDKRNCNLIPLAYKEMAFPSENSSGSFFLNFYVWDRSQEYLNQSGVSRADLDALAGVSIFRERLRVLPYGEPGNDWLDLDRERINDPSGRIGNQQIIGFVEVYQADTPDLRDKTNREGLIDNSAFRDLRALVRAAINVFTSEWLHDRPRARKKSQNVNHTLDSEDALKKATTLAEVVAETARDDIVIPLDAPLTPNRDQHKADIRPSVPSPTLTKQEVPPQSQEDNSRYLTQRQAMHHLVEYLQEAITHQSQSENEAEERIQILMHLAATGMAAERVVHEFGLQVNAAISALRSLRALESRDTETSQAIRILDTCIGTLRNEFRVLAPYEAGWHLQRTEMQSLQEAVTLAIKLNERSIRAANITVEVTGDDFIVMARSASLVQVFDNLMHNACSWLEGYQGTRRIQITLNRDTRSVTVLDTGPGVPEHMQEEIFKPFVTLRNGGRGLGLYITRELLHAIQATITLDKTENSQGVSFLLRFPELNR